MISMYYIIHIILYVLYNTYVTNKRQKGWSFVAQIFVATQMTPGIMYIHEKKLNPQNYLLLCYRRENVERLSNN